MNDKRLHQAHALNARGDSAAAARLLAQILRKEPSNVTALVTLAEIELTAEHHDTARERLQKALRIRRDFVPALVAFARACWLSGDPVQALNIARRCAELEPREPRHRLLLSQLLHRTGDPAQAGAILQADLANNSNDRSLLCELHTELARQLDSEARYQDAIAEYQRAIAIDPRWVDAQVGYSRTLLRCGLYLQGWAAAETMRTARQAKLGLPWVPPEFFWDGRQNLNGQVLALVDDAGFGDAIQNFRYVKLLRAHGAKILYRALQPLVPLFLRAAPYITFVPRLENGTRFNFICYTDSLPAVFSTTVETIPNQIPYLAPDPALIEHWSAEFAGSTGLRIGLAWSGNPKNFYDYRRSIPADVFLRLTDVPNATFFNLQLATRPSDLPALQRRPGVRNVGEKFKNFDDTAAVLAQFDLVISADTAVAHLAGALGRPVWLVIGHIPEWRWLLNREDSPWYPTMRIFRQNSAGPWDEVIERVHSALHTLARGR
jgi:tetratricopeptide (TPR) repeat protein